MQQYTTTLRPNPSQNINEALRAQLEQRDPLWRGVEISVLCIEKLQGGWVKLYYGSLQYDRKLQEQNNKARTPFLDLYHQIKNRK